VTQIVRGKAAAKAIFAAQPPERLVYRAGAQSYWDGVKIAK
jgi:hypothetical protein